MCVKGSEKRPAGKKCPVLTAVAADISCHTRWTRIPQLPILGCAEGRGHTEQRRSTLRGRGPDGRNGRILSRNSQTPLGPPVRHSTAQR